MRLASEGDSSVQGDKTMTSGVCAPVPRCLAENASHVRANVHSLATDTSEGSTSSMDRGSSPGRPVVVRTFPKSRVCTVGGDLIHRVIN